MADRNSAAAMWMRVVTTIMIAFGLFGAGFGASQALLCSEIRRIDQQGSQRVQVLERDVAVLKTTYERDFVYIRDSLTEIKDGLKAHAKATGAPVP